jgi:hypothetical protein
MKHSSAQHAKIRLTTKPSWADFNTERANKYAAPTHNATIPACIQYRYRSESAGPNCRVCEILQRLAFFRSLDPQAVDGKLLARPRTKEALVRQLRDYLHQVCHALGLSIRIVPHQLRHTYATEMLRAGVSFPVLMKLLGDTSPEMTMRYLDVALTDVQREFQLARSQPRHLVPQPKVPLARLRRGLDGVVDSLLAAQHVLEMFRRALPKGPTRECLDRLSNGSRRFLAKPANFPRPETERRLAGYADHPDRILVPDAPRDTTA